MIASLELILFVSRQIVEHEGLNDLHRVATLARRLDAKLGVQRHLLDVLERHVQAAVVPVVEG